MIGHKYVFLNFDWMRFCFVLKIKPPGRHVPKLLFLKLNPRGDIHVPRPTGCRFTILNLKLRATMPMKRSDYDPSFARTCGDYNKGHSVPTLSSAMWFQLWENTLISPIPQTSSPTTKNYKKMLELLF